MRASRIFDNGRGDKYEVCCEFYDSTSSSRWRMWVFVKPKGKRKFVALGSSDNELRIKRVPYEDYEKYRIREYLKEIPWSWVEMVMDDICVEIRKLGSELYPKDE